MLDIINSKVTLYQGVDGHSSYELVNVMDDGELETRVFRRIAGGAAWPSKGQPGYLMAVAEDMEYDMELETRHYRRIYETGAWMGQALMTCEAMLEAMYSLSSRFGIRPWYCLPCPFLEALRDFHHKKAHERKGRLKLEYLRDPDFERFLSPVYRRLTTSKTLHFGQSDTVAMLGNLDKDVSGETFESNPQITALLMAVNGLEHTRVDTVQRPAKRFTADRVGGY